jgi:DNA-binding NarL/FixJ family response regulator
VLKTLVLTTTGTLRHELLTFLRSVPNLSLLDSGDGRVPVSLAERPDLVVLDASLPGVSSEALLQELRSRLPGTRCILLVGSPSQMAEAVAAGADRVLLVGFSAAEFFQILKEIEEDKDAYS